MPLLVHDGERFRRARLADYRDILEALLLLLKQGEVTSYGELARLLGLSPRSIGRLLKGNERPIVIPCHRVVRSDGGLGGYSLGGERVKRRLLEFESEGKPKFRRLSREFL